MIARLAFAFSALALVAPTVAASFDCAKAVTPFEKAICQNDALSLADETLAKAFATATGGLTKQSVNTMRSEQRGWLDFAQRACTEDAQPISSGRYDDDASACLVDLFKARSAVLENSRMQGGHRFLVKSIYDALQDQHEIDNPDSYWKVATHEVALIQLDSDDRLADAFNRWVIDKSKDFTDVLATAGGETGEGLSDTADTAVTMSVKAVGGTHRITLAVDTYWFGHGAAHGSYTTSLLHYYTPEQREIVAEDIFAGADWQKVLAHAAWQQLQVQHKQWLQVESVDDIAEIVVDPQRWDLDDDYGLVIQFQPYEVSAYAYGAPTVTIPWEALDPIKAGTQDEVRYGW